MKKSKILGIILTAILLLALLYTRLSDYSIALKQNWNIEMPRNIKMKQSFQIVILNVLMNG